MRKIALPCALALSLASGTALAQYSGGQYPGAIPPPPAARPPTTGYTPAPTGGYAAPPAAAYATPPGANPETGARPGNDIGTGMSLPTGSQASNIGPSDTTTTIAPNLPSPPVGPNANAADYLAAARNALSAGRTGEAQQALEMAQTRLLSRSVPLFQTNTPSANPVVQQISQALQALGVGDTSRCMQLIDAAIPNARMAEATP
jgi:hypothetical protein